MFEELIRQSLRALGYYVALIAIMRLAGKRLAGQTTTFDLIVIITLGVVLQGAALQAGFANALVFVATVFAAHLGLADLCARSTWIHELVRGKPCALVRDGRILERTLVREGMNEEELLAGLRKLGFESPDRVKLAVLEETGHISAIGLDVAPSDATP